VDRGAQPGLEIVEMIVEELPGGFTRAALVGRMDIEGAMAIEDQIQPLSRLRRKLVIDLSEVTFIASMGLRTLVTAARSLSEIGGKATLANPQPNVEKVLEMSGIGPMLGVHPTVDAAVAALQA
jgi:anti-anti-sigma factor